MDDRLPESLTAAVRAIASAARRDPACRAALKDAAAALVAWLGDDDTPRSHAT